MNDIIDQFIDIKGDINEMKKGIVLLQEHLFNLIQKLDKHISVNNKAKCFHENVYPPTQPGSAAAGSQS